MLFRSRVQRKTLSSLLKVAGNSFQHFPRLRVCWVTITTLCWLMPKSWYQQTAQLLVNKLLLIVWHNRLPYQQYDLLKTPLILASSAYNSKSSSVTPIFYYRIVISMIRCNFLQSLKKFCEGVQSHLKFSKVLFCPFIGLKILIPLHVIYQEL